MNQRRYAHQYAVRTVSDSSYESVHGYRPVEDHLRRHGLLAHKVAIFMTRKLPWNKIEG